jgi:hypothetical protein
MLVHINQPRFMPALNYFQRMVIADAFIYRDDVQYQPKCWENRNKIKTQSGWKWISVPVRDCPVGTNICKARIDHSLPWARKTLAAIRCNYAKAPYFDEWFPRFEKVLNHRFETLTALNWCIIDLFLDAWKIECRFSRASVLECDGDTDGILIEMCKKLGADTYLSGSEGRNYNRPEEWKKAGIALTYHDYEPVEYPQQFGEFVPWMSAIDLLMNCGADGRDVLDSIAPAKAA